MAKTTTRNAADILPKALLSKLQKHCSGLIYIPAKQTKSQMNISRVWSLHSRGWRPAEIARAIDVSAQHVRDIIGLDEEGISGSRRYKVYESVPRELVETVQKYVSGPIYVPPKVSDAARRQSFAQRLLRKGIPVSEIAELSGLSERRVRQIRKAETELAQSEVAAGKAGKSNTGNRRDRFDVDSVIDSDYVPLKRCSVCGLPVGPDEQQCDVCAHSAKTKRKTDSDVIVLHDFPYAVLNRSF